ncbi:MAG: cytochrome c-type biogenesis protein [Candidatus Binatia bacterium]
MLRPFDKLRTQHERSMNRRGNPMWLPFLWVATQGRPYSIILLILLFLYSVAAASLPTTTQEVEESLTCQCGCGLTVHSCNHLQCGFAVPAKQEIAKQVSEGKDREQIVATFLTRYGEKVLSAPTTSGFNLAAWITPFLAVLVGGVLIGFMSLRWNRRRQQNEAQTPPVSPKADQYRERLKKELETFDR